MWVVSVLVCVFIGGLLQTNPVSRLGIEAVLDKLHNMGDSRSVDLTLTRNVLTQFGLGDLGSKCAAACCAIVLLRNYEYTYFPFCACLLQFMSKILAFGLVATYIA